MEGPNTYDHILKQKLNQLEAPGMDAMWGEMHAMLDNKMPQEKKRRFFIWFFNRYKIMLLALAFCSVTVSWYALKTKSGTSDSITVTKESINKNVSESVIGIINAEVENTKPVIKTVSGSKETKVRSNEIKEIPSKSITTRKKDQQSAFITDELSPVEIKQFNSFSAQPKELYVTIQRQRKKLASEKSYLDIVSSVPASVKLVASKMITTAVHSNVPENITPAVEVDDKDQINSLKRMNTAATSIPADINTFPNTSVVQLRMVNVDPKSLKIQPQRKSRSYFVAGLSVNYHVPVSGQEMSTINSLGNENRLVDYIPAVFAQYHLNDKWFIQAEFQYTSPQYIQPIKMASTFTPINANKKTEEAVTLSKLYYLNLPLSIHYKPTKNMSIGTGVQYSYLRNSIIESEICTWEKTNNSWNKTYEKKKVHVKSSPGQEKKNASNNPATPQTSVDTLAQSLRTNDWRLVVDVNYKWRKITGGAKFNTGLNKYIDISSGGVSSTLKDKNEAFQLYIRYDLFRTGKRKAH